MPTPEFDTDGLFDHDYLHFTGDALDEHSSRDSELVATLLGLDGGEHVLDLACGHGRIANQLARRGCTVTGLDASTVFLDRARHDAREAGLTVHYVHGDMRHLPWEAEFDHVVNWFTAYGYFDDHDNAQVLHEVARALRPGGTFLLDINNHAWLLRNFQPTRLLRHGEDLMIDHSELDLDTYRIVSRRTLVRDGRTRTVPYFVRLFSFPEIRDRLHTAGFTSVHAVGEDAEPLRLDHRRMIVSATR